ncbi:hypothetical protein AGMMS49546_25860 [Spirochaetia bacterium]|nr:hypothetical protein AGMMS49546_25860 [Spirochaetia bacterium]
MRKFLFKFAILFLLILVTMTAIILIPAPENTYMRAMIDKHQRLANTVSPRIVLVGGSNLAFGIDSKAMQDTLNIPVVNTGIHAGIGLGRMLDDAAPFLHTGDIVVIAPEYSHFTSDWNGSSSVLYKLIFDTRRHSLIAHKPFYSHPSYLDFFIYAKNKLLSFIPRPPHPLAYTRDGFNEYGDYVKHLEQENQPITPAETIGEINTQYLSSFFKLADYLTGQGIRVIITYPSYATTTFQNSATVIHKLDAAFRAKQNISVISSPDDYCFPVDYFYDTTYHLNAKGRKIRTERLIQDLKRQLGQ